MSALQAQERAVPGIADQKVAVDSWWRDSNGIRLAWRVAAALVTIPVGIVIGKSVDSHGLFILTSIVAAALVASCLNLVMGYAGQLNLANGGFLALGAYVGVIGTARDDWSGLTSMFLAGGVAAIVSALLGLVIFRARGLHFALLTAGISIVVYHVAISWRDMTGGAAGLSTAGPIEEGGIPRPLALGPVEVSDAEGYYVTLLVCLVLLLLATTVLVRHRLGRSWRAIRDDETLAASIGIRVARGKRIAFTLSSVLVAMVGVIYGHWLGYITPGAFTFQAASFEPLATVIIGGAGTVAGPLIGAAVVAGLPELSSGFAEHSTLVYGAALLLVVLVAPRGIVGLIHTLWCRLMSRLPRKGEGKS